MLNTDQHLDLAAIHPTHNYDLTTLIHSNHPPPPLHHPLSTRVAQAQDRPRRQKLPCKRQSASNPLRCPPPAQLNPQKTTSTPTKHLQTPYPSHYPHCNLNLLTTQIHTTLNLDVQNPILHTQTLSNIAQILQTKIQTHTMAFPDLLAPIWIFAVIVFLIFAVLFYVLTLLFLELKTVEDHILGAIGYLKNCECGGRR